MDAVSPTWNVTLFHYRNTGNRESSVLLGVQVPPDQDGAFKKMRRALLRDEFAFAELAPDERRVFDMFIT